MSLFFYLQKYFSQLNSECAKTVILQATYFMFIFQKIYITYSYPENTSWYLLSQHLQFLVETTSPKYLLVEMGRS